MGSPGRCALGVTKIRIEQAHKKFTTYGKFFQLVLDFFFRRFVDSREIGTPP